MASISTRTFVNASLALTINGPNMKRFEVLVGQHSYVLVVWGGGKIDQCFKQMKHGGFICHLPKKTAFAFLLAVMQEGLLDLNPKDYT